MHVTVGHPLPKWLGGGGRGGAAGTTQSVKYQEQPNDPRYDVSNPAPGEDRGKKGEKFVAFIGAFMKRGKVIVVIYSKSHLS
jgi:hypothetical protein